MKTCTAKTLALRRMASSMFSEPSSGQYQLTLKSNNNVLTPGYWMLFALQDGVPSVSHVIQVVNQA